MRTNPRRPAALLAAALLVLAACSGGGDGGGATAGDGDPGNGELAAQCPVDALDGEGGPVPVTFWHSMTRANEETLTALTDEFNTSQEAVRVTLVNQTSYDDTLTKYKAALGGGTLPDLMQIQDVDQQLVIDSQGVIPVEACVEADDYPLDDFLPRVLRYYTVRGTQWAMPFSVSNPILYFNANAFEKAGLDPAAPPRTLEELRAASQKVVDAGAATFGMAIKTDPWYLEEWLAMAGELYADEDNGRTGRATSVRFDGETGREVFAWLAGMVRDKLAQVTPQQGFDNLLALGNEAAAMTLDTSAALGTIVQVLGSGQFPNVRLGVGPLPGPDPDGGTVVAGSALFVLKRSAPERQAAAWAFVKYLLEPEQVAEWAVGTGYIPIRQSATELPDVEGLWIKAPEFRVAYDQLTRGDEDFATDGPVIGDFGAVRAAVIAAQESIFQQGADPAEALRSAAAAADRAIADYESRLGG